MQINVHDLEFYNITIIDENGEFVEYDLREELKVNENNIEKEMIINQPTKYIYWSRLLEIVTDYQEAENLKMDILIGTLDEQARDAITHGGGKPTKDSVDAYIKRTEAYQQQRNICKTYAHLVKVLTRVVKAFEQRKDMLQSYAKYISTNKVYGHGAGRLEQ